MKVLLVIYNYKAGFPFIQDLAMHLKQQPDLEVDTLDTDEMFVKTHNGTIHTLTENLLVKRLLPLPKIGTALRLFFLKRYLQSQQGKYDAVGLHSCDAIYVYLAKALRSITPNFYPMIWGSDFYRATPAWLKKKRVIFDNARNIIFANPVNARDFTRHYREYHEKAIINGFGVAKFDLIKQIRAENTLTSLKIEFGLPLDKIIVAVGYNGSKGQQHKKILNELSGLPAVIREKIFLVLQMTYGHNQVYTQEVIKHVAQSGINYRLIDAFLDDRQIASLRLAVDVVLNAQISDGFSSSIQEHLFAGNIVVVGDWLPYLPLELANIIFFKKRLQEFGATLQSIVEQYAEMKDSVTGNAEKLYRLSSWRSRIKNWVDIYAGRGDRFRYNEQEMQIR